MLESTARLNEELKKAAPSSTAIILENETLELDGYRFFGATLWTDFNLLDDEQPRCCRSASTREAGATIQESAGVTPARYRIGNWIRAAAGRQVRQEWGFLPRPVHRTHSRDQEGG
jgi:hypothetical protein